MAFSVTYHHLAKHNIRNIYGGLPQEIRFKKPTHIQAISPAQRSIEYQKRPPDRYNVKYNDYVTDFDILLPRAPAFRLLNRVQVDEIVLRVSRTTNSRQRPLETCHKEIKRSDEDTCSLCKVAMSPRQVKKGEMGDITDRLLRPTVSAKIRSRMRDPNGFSVGDLRAACHRRIPPSVRYAMKRDQSIA